MAHSTAWHAREAADVVRELRTDPHHGLSAGEAWERLGAHGPNELSREQPVSAVNLFLRQFKNVLIVILVIAIVLSALVGETADAAIIAVIVLFVALLGFVQEYRAERALEALRKMLSPTVTVLRDGKEEDVPSRELVPGDVLLLEAGDRIAADARLVEEHSLQCDEAPLTGESLPVEKRASVVAADAPIGDRRNILFTGTTVTYGRGRAVVIATGMATEFGRIAKEVTAVRTEATPLEKRTAEIGKWLGLIALGICFLVAGVSIAREHLRTGTVEPAFIITIVMFAIALAVAAVPEALAAIVTAALAIGMRQMAKQNALVRKMPAVETLGCTTVICSDKTGTLTRGEMTVRQVYAGGMTLDVGGTGYEPAGAFRSGREPAAMNGGLRRLLAGGVLCSDSDLRERDGMWSVTGDPTEGALVVAAVKAGLKPREMRLDYPRVEEIPFSSERKRMTTIHERDGQRTAFMKGAPEVVLERCTRVWAEGGERPLTDGERAAILRVNEDMAGRALRVLAVAERDFPPGADPGDDPVEQEMVFLGLAGMMDPPRPEAMEAIRTCREVRVRPVMITGDHALTAVAVAKEMDIFRDGDRVMTGPELSLLSDEEFARIVDRVTVYARVSPLDKLKIVKAWKQRGDVVAMTGDGVNDAPALKHADIGIAMGITGTEVTKEAADMILTDDNFATIVKAIERGRWIYDNIKKYLTYLLRANITEVAVIGGVVLMMGPEYLPLLPAAILYINLATDGLPALALGVSPPDPDIMQRPPRDPRESVFTRDVLVFIFMALLVEIPFFYYLFLREMDNMLLARTDIFFLFIVVELAAALNFRSLRFSAFTAPPHRWLLLAIVWELVLVAVLVQVPALRVSFGIALPTAHSLLLITGFSILVFLSLEALKAVLRTVRTR